MPITLPLVIILIVANIRSSSKSALLLSIVRYFGSKRPKRIILRREELLT